MYCHPCQKSFSEDAIYCSQCGQKLTVAGIVFEAKKEQTIAIFPSDEPQQLAVAKQKQHHTKQKAFFKFMFRSTIVMMIVLICISTVLIFTYRKESNINEQVLALQSEAKRSALNGSYEEALEKLETATQLRPDFQSLKADQDIIYEAVRIQRLADEINEALEIGIEIESEKKLNQFRQELNGLKEPIFNPHREQLETMNMKYNVLSLTNELSEIFTVDELGNLLNIVNGIAGEDASTLREQIKDRIRTTTVAEVNELIKLRRYSASITSINQSLKWLRSDEQLLDLKKNIEEQQLDYERAEQERIQKAMEQQAAEDYINQTAAVELVSFSKRMDELGQGVIIVSLKNVATRAIYDIDIEYSALDANGEVLYIGKTDVEPNYVLSHEGMFFNFTLPVEVDVAMVNQVIINNGTWSLD